MGKKSVPIPPYLLWLILGGNTFYILKYSKVFVMVLILYSLKLVGGFKGIYGEMLIENEDRWSSDSKT